VRSEVQVLPDPPLLGWLPDGVLVLVYPFRFSLERGSWDCVAISGTGLKKHSLERGCRRRAPSASQPWDTLSVPEPIK
jgi:hypothetical protein